MNVTRHLSVGSTCPPMEDGYLRLYGMGFCPFVQRVRLVLNVKAIPHDIVNVNLKQKPEWYFNIHPQGKVPALDTGKEVIVESLEIADYLDAKNPEPPLYPSDPERKAKDKELIAKFGRVVNAITIVLHDKKKPLSTYMDEAYGILAEFETELACRGTTFFGASLSGEEPGMVDLMIWPWSERCKLPSLLRDEDMDFPKERFPKLVAWREAMQQLDTVRDTMTDLDTHLKFLTGYLSSDPNSPFDDL